VPQQEKAGKPDPERQQDEPQDAVASGGRVAAADDRNRKSPEEAPLGPDSAQESRPCREILRSEARL